VIGLQRDDEALNAPRYELGDTLYDSLGRRMEAPVGKRLDEAGAEGRLALD